MSDTPLPPNSPVPAASQGEIDASCRLPVLALFTGAAFWLLVSAVATMLASMSFHKPDMFADCMWMSYGRILPFAKTTLLYGFCLPAGYGLALWLAARLGRTTLAGAVTAFIGAKVWNLGVLIGSFGILCGASTGYEGFEMPRYAAFMLFVAALLLGYVGLLTIHNRTEKEMYPSLWFIITALLWFPWILSTAILLLDGSPVRGVAQVAVQFWYLNNLQFVVLGLFGMGATLYFIPKLAVKPLYSKYLALFALFTLVLFGGWGGIPVGGPLPAWIGSLSSIAMVFAVVPALAHMDNLRRTCCIKAPDAEAKFFSLSVPFLFLAAVLAAVIGFTQSLQLTLFRSGQVVLLVQGFFALVALGGIYHVLPKVTGFKWPFAGLVRWHFWLALGGVLLIAVPYLVGGVQQAGKLAQPGVTFVDVAKSTLMPIRAASLGELFWALGGLLLAVNVLVVAYRCFRLFLHPVTAELGAPYSAAEVKA